MFTIKYSTLYSYLICFCLYIYIYNPPFVFLPVTPNRFLWIVAFMYIIMKHEFLYFLSCFKKEIFIMLLICIYSCYVSKGGDASLFVNNNFITLCDTFLLSFFFCFIFRKVVIPKQVFYVTLVASLITLLLIMSPALTENVRSILRTDVDKGSIRFRSFGLSENLTFGYGLVQGILLAFSFSLVKKYNKIIWFLPIIFISILFNARIGFVPIVFYFIYLIFLKRDFKLLLKIVVLSTFVLFIILYFPYFGELQETVYWGLDFFSQLYEWVILNDNSGDEGNTISTLLVDMFILPNSTKALWLGDGINVRSYTDVGFFQQINFGGIVLCLIWMYLFKCIYCRWIKNTILPKWLIIIFMLTLFIANIKGNAFVTTPFLRLLIILYVYDILYFRKKYILNS